MRIAPIQPRNPLLRVIDRVVTRLYGKPLTPFRVIFTRFPRLMAAQAGLYWGLAARKGIEPELQLLIQGYVAAVNGCTFCEDMGRTVATYQGIAHDRLEEIADWRRSAAFTPRERAALAYVEEANRDRRVSDETFAELRRHFDDQQIVAITWLNAVENYFNFLNGPLGIESDGLCAIAEGRVARRRSRPSPASAA